MLTTFQILSSNPPLLDLQSCLSDMREGFRQFSYQVGSVIKGAHCKDALDALLQPRQLQDGGKPALHRPQLFYITVAPVLRMLTLQVRQMFSRSSGQLPLDVPSCYLAGAETSQRSFIHAVIAFQHDA